MNTTHMAVLESTDNPCKCKESWTLYSLGSWGEGPGKAEVENTEQGKTSREQDPNT